MSKSETPLNVLVIEDDEGLRQLLARIINHAEHQVVLAESAEEGLSLLPHWTFHIAFVDQNLPGMEGLVLGDYLRRNNPDMSIVMMTGSADPRVERESKNLSLKFLAKPFQVSQILDVIDEYVELANERDEKRLAEQDQLYGPPIESFVDDLAECYSVPKVPARVEESLAQTVKQCLNNLKSAARYTERDRVVALSGLLTAQVLGVSLPRTKGGRTLFEEYDQLMLERGRRTEFGAAGPRSARG